jgi:N-acetylglutamate synthase-like GNAT family acetyltransferase
MKDMRGIVRGATLKDLEAVLEFDTRAQVSAERRSLLSAQLQFAEVIIFEQEGRVLGYVALRPHSFFERDFVELLAVAVNERRQGIGSLLLQQCVDLSSTKRIFTSTNQSNLPMIALLEKRGWEFSGQLEGIDDGDPELIYYKDSVGVPFETSEN